MGLLLCAICAVIMLCLLPYIVEKIYKLNPICEFFNTKLDVSVFLDYFSGLLSFLGASILGILTLRQNQKAQEKSEEVNRLQLELQKKSMAMAQAQYSAEKQIQNISPKFEVKLNGYNGNYASMRISMKNVSSMIVSCISPVSFDIYRNNGELFANNITMKPSKRSLSPSEALEIETNTSSLVDREYNSQQSLQGVRLCLKFSCDDEKGNRHYYQSSIVINDTYVYCGDLWKTEKIG